MSPIEHVDSYRAYGRAIRIVAALDMPDLRKKSRIITYLYEQGHVSNLALNAMDIRTFADAFDASRAKDRRAA